MSEIEIIGQQADPLPALVSRWLLTKESANTRAAYRTDLAQFSTWCEARGGHVLDAGETAISLWNRELSASGITNSSRARKMTSLSSFYRWAVRNRVLTANPVEGLDRPPVDYSTSMTPGLTVAQVRSLVAAADACSGPGRLRTSALVALLVFTGVRISEALNADIEDLGADRGHRTLKIARKGGKVQAIALPAPVIERIEAYLTSRPDVSAELAVPGPSGQRPRRPLFVTARGGRYSRREAHRAVQRVARDAGLPDSLAVHPHTLRHVFVTLSLDAGAALRDVQAAAGHANPATTMRYDRSRQNLDRSPTYTLASYLSE